MPLVEACQGLCQKAALRLLSKPHTVSSTKEKRAAQKAMIPKGRLAGRSRIALGRHLPRLSLRREPFTQTRSTPRSNISLAKGGRGQHGLPSCLIWALILDQSGLRRDSAVA